MHAHSNGVRGYEGYLATTAEGSYIVWSGHSRNAAPVADVVELNIQTIPPCLT